MRENLIPKIVDSHFGLSSIYISSAIQILFQWKKTSYWGLDLDAYYTTKEIFYLDMGRFLTE